MDQIVSPVVLFLCIAGGGLGVALALPRRGVSPQILGALIAGAAIGVLMLVLALRALSEGQLPNLFFYVFALIALGSGLRVITHPKPVYAALYFILTILSSSALYLLLHAEFMAFALIIIYAGAILITYLFVIMLATQAPSEEALERLSDYDAASREPMFATIAGFVMLALLTGIMARGLPTLTPNAASATDPDLLAQLPKKVLRHLGDRGVFAGLERPSPSALTPVDGSPGLLDLEAGTITLTVSDAARFEASLDSPRVAELIDGATGGAAGDAVTVRLPDTLAVSNVEGVGFALIDGHPMALELAGVILLMAMLGAVVLARKQVELTEQEKAAQARTLGQTEDALGSAGAGGAA